MHTPVLLDEVIKFLNLKNGDIVIDATVDGGGHAERIIGKIMPDGKFVGIDLDKKFVNELRKKFSAIEKTKFVVGNFRNIDKIAQDLKIRNINAALFDLGMSSSQLEESGRGFSFLKDEPLLMTFKSELLPEDLTARKILAGWPRSEIESILRDYGEERYFRRIAKAVSEERKKRPIETTFDLVRIINKAIPGRRQKIHPATRTFQALRIAVNDELNSLKEGIEKAWNLLLPGGRLAIISFHSLEDRIVKQFFKEKRKSGAGVILTPKPVVPEVREIKANPRSRSSKLRAAEKIKEN